MYLLRVSLWGRASWNVPVPLGKRVGKHFASLPLSVSSLTGLLPSAGAIDKTLSKCWSNISCAISIGCKHVSKSNPCVWVSYMWSASSSSDTWSDWVVMSLLSGADGVSLTGLHSFKTEHASSGKGFSHSALKSMSLYHLFMSFKHAIAFWIFWVCTYWYW